VITEQINDDDDDDDSSVIMMHLGLLLVAVFYRVCLPYSAI